MEKTILNQEIDRIQNTQLRETLIAYFNHVVPDYFWTIPSSSSGKYHSSFDSGEGGLVRHTKMCVLVAEELLRLEEFNKIDPDCMYAAMLLHDSFKHGKDGRHYRADHPRLRDCQKASLWQSLTPLLGIPVSGPAPPQETTLKSLLPIWLKSSAHTCATTLPAGVSSTKLTPFNISRPVHQGGFFAFQHNLCCISDLWTVRTITDII